MTFLSGLGLIRQKAWGWLWLGTGLSIGGLAVVGIRLLTSGRFAFEPTLGSGIASLGSGICFWLEYRKSLVKTRAAAIEDQKHS